MITKSRTFHVSFGVKEKGFKVLFEVQLYLLTVRFYEDLIIGEILLVKLFLGGNHRCLVCFFLSFNRFDFHLRHLKSRYYRIYLGLC